MATVALVVAGTGWAIIQAQPERPGLPRPEPVVMMRPAEAALSLTARLRALDATWTSESTAAQADLDAATAEFSRFMDEARATGRTSVQEVQRRAAEIGELSAALRQRRQRHAEAAAAYPAGAGDAPGHIRRQR
jgi:hypothetical protein